MDGHLGLWCPTVSLTLYGATSGLSSLMNAPWTSVGLFFCTPEQKNPFVGFLDIHPPKTVYYIDDLLFDPEDEEVMDRNEAYAVLGAFLEDDRSKMKFPRRDYLRGQTHCVEAGDRKYSK